MAGRIYALGESLIDVIFNEGEARTSRPGGSSFNAAISLGRLGVPVCMLTELGQDLAGDLVISFMQQNGVDSSYVARHADMQTAIALAFLDKNQDAHYQFYKNPSRKSQGPAIPDFGPEDQLLFGSFYALNPELRSKVRPILDKARSAGATLVYDPNFRNNHKDEKGELIELVKENMRYADLVRASDEDLQNLFGAENADTAWEAVSDYCDILVYTASSRKVELRSRDISLYREVKPIVPVSTIGAGDTFNAGLLYGFWEKHMGREDLSGLGPSDWAKILDRCIAFSARVCQSLDNYLPAGYQPE